MSDRIGHADARDWAFAIFFRPITRRIERPIDIASIKETKMTALKFRLTQMHQRIDEHLRMELRKRRPDWLEVLRLKKTKLRVKDALHRLSRSGQLA